MNLSLYLLFGWNAFSLCINLFHTQPTRGCLSISSCTLDSRSVIYEILKWFPPSPRAGSDLIANLSDEKFILLQRMETNFHIYSCILCNYGTSFWKVNCASRATQNWSPLTPLTILGRGFSGKFYCISCLESDGEDVECLPSKLPLTSFLSILCLEWMTKIQFPCSLRELEIEVKRQKVGIKIN